MAFAFGGGRSGGGLGVGGGLRPCRCCAGRDLVDGQQTCRREGLSAKSVVVSRPPSGCIRGRVALRSGFGFLGSSVCARGWLRQRDLLMTHVWAEGPGDMVAANPVRQKRRCSKGTLYRWCRDLHRIGNQFGVVGGGGSRGDLRSNVHRCGGKRYVAGAMPPYSCVARGLLGGGGGWRWRSAVARCTVQRRIVGVSGSALAFGSAV